MKLSNYTSVTIVENPSSPSGYCRGTRLFIRIRDISVIFVKSLMRENLNYRNTCESIPEKTTVLNVTFVVKF